MLLRVSSAGGLTLLFLTAVLSCAPTPSLSYATPPRRTLHQPFFPQDSIPPSHPPSPSKIPFSENTPDNSTFFPSSPSHPPPPSPSTFASFPANISSLILPQSPGPNRNSKNALIAGLSSSFAALLILGIFVFFHRRRKTRNKTHSAPRAGKPRPDPSTRPSTEFLYMGTLVDSRNTLTDPNRNTSSPNPGSYRIKPDSQSPELRPLPPLNPTRNRTDIETEPESTGDEEFYSPRGSLGGGRDSSTTGTDTGSMRVYTVYVLPSDETTSSQYSSSNSGSGSPDRSSISPPVSLSPRPKSPALLPLPPPNIRPLHATSPHREIEATEQLTTEEDDLSTKISTSPERDFNKNNIISEGNFYASSSASSERLNPPPPPPPPPPPLPPLVRKMRSDSPVVSTPTGQPIIWRPPELIAPSRPFVVKVAETEVSPLELPPAESVSTNPKPRLKPLHWDKVRASSDREMVWDHLKSSSFKLNEEMIETLFVVNTPNPETSSRLVVPTACQESRVLDPKKAQNVLILLRALNVTAEEVCESLLEGNAKNLGSEFLESLLKMAPTKEEERKLRDYKDDSSNKLGHAEKFLKAVLDVPFAFERVEAMLYIANFDSEVEYLKKSFGTLEAACEELRNSRMFFKLLEAVLKTGNRMNVGTNRGDAHAFKLDTLLKLVDVKGADGKTTLLHFVVQEIIRTEGARVSSTNQDPSCSANEDAKCRKLGLQVVSGLSTELANVKKAAGMDSDVLTRDVSKLSRGVQDICELIRLIEAHELDPSSQKFSESMKKFMKMAEEEIIRIQAQESVALSLVKEITEYFHGNSAKEEAHPFRIFMVVRDFLGILDRVCKEVGLINERTMVPSSHKFPVPVNPTLPQAFAGHNIVRQYSSSDDESMSSW